MSRYDRDGRRYDDEGWDDREPVGSGRAEQHNRRNFIAGIAAGALVISMYVGYSDKLAFRNPIYYPPNGQQTDTGTSFNREQESDAQGGSRQQSPGDRPERQATDGNGGGGGRQPAEESAQAAPTDENAGGQANPGSVDPGSATGLPVHESVAISGDTAYVAVAGDICKPDTTGCEATAGLLRQLEGTTGIDAILAPGDTAYDSGTAEDFARFDGVWGEFKEKILPVIGNHEAQSGGDGFYDYFYGGVREGNEYYAAEIGNWVIIGVDSEGDLKPGSAQHTAIQTYLAGLGEGRCVLTFHHHPAFSSGKHGSEPGMQPVFDTFAQGGVDIDIAGHDHNYERFAPQAGVRAFVVGTGGAQPRPVGSPIANSEFVNDTDLGVLLLELRPDGYKADFMSTDGSILDSVEDSCANP